jgi:hypothetical protein
MKITKGRLKEIIKEELGDYDSTYAVQDYDTASEDYDPNYTYGEEPSEEQYGSPVPETPVEIAHEEILNILKNLWGDDRGDGELINDADLKQILLSLLDNLEQGFIGEPT